MKTSTRLAIAGAVVAATAALAAVQGQYSVKQRRPRATKKILRWEESPFGLLLLNCRDVGDGAALAEFRKAVNIPYEVYCKIFDRYDASHPSTPDARGVISTAAGVAVLASLAKLTTAAADKTLRMLTNLSEEVIRRTTIHVLWFIDTIIFPEVVVQPTEENGLLGATLREYNAVGLPGCIGSVDCTHIEWAKCPASQRSLYVGKEGFPSVVFEVVCSHSRRILSCTKAFPGSFGDATIAKYDDFLTSIDRGTFDDYSFRLYDEEGNSFMERGLYLIADGGYFDCRYLQAPMKNARGSEQLFSDHIESMRKDIEHIFGILKGRFRLLSGKVHSHSLEFIVGAFRSACAIHNMILDHDGNSTACAIVAVYESRSDGRDYMYDNEQPRAGRSARRDPIEQSSRVASADLRRKLVANYMTRIELGTVVNKEVARLRY